MEYESKAKTISIKATSRVAIKLKDNYYTVEYTEERSVPDEDGVDVNQERNILWNEVNASVDAQCDEIVRTFK